MSRVLTNKVVSGANMPTKIYGHSTPITKFLTARQLHAYSIRSISVACQLACMPNLLNFSSNTPPLVSSHINQVVNLIKESLQTFHAHHTSYTLAISTIAIGSISVLISHL